MRRVLGAAALALFVAGAVVSCGARDELPVGPAAPRLPECVVDADCEGFDDLCLNVRCVPDDGAGGRGDGGGDPDRRAVTVKRGVCREVNPIDCDDADVCTIDICGALDGSCTYEPATFDNDGDGFNGPREGFKAGAPDSCGDDCDDANEDAFPGNTEVCDGADNDCNGVVDDNATFVPAGVDAVRVSGELAPAGAGGLAWSGVSYGATYWGTTDGFDIYRAMLAPTGEKVQPELRLTAFNSDSAGGPIVWTGDRYGVLWQERPNNDYEIYFRVLDIDGQTVVTSPVQVSDGFDGFSVNPDLGFTGTSFVAAWQDERNGLFEVYGQMLDIDGQLLGSDVLLSDGADNFDNESPVVAASSEGIGVAWARGGTSAHFIRFRRFGFDLAPLGPSIDLTDGTTGAVYPTIVWNDGEYVVAWYDPGATPKGIYAAVIGADGTVQVPARAISNPGSARSRYPTMRALGDRVLFVYADDRDLNSGYELYARMVDAKLDPLGPEQRVTSTTGDSIYPKSAFGPDGNVGILFRDDRSGQQHVWFTRLGCVVPP